MQRIETFLPDVFELRPVIHRDARGFFIETYHKAKFATLGIADAFVQDNHSRSIKGTLRGLHYQLHHPQAKLCRVVERSEEHTSELQSRGHLVCRLLLEKKKYL